LLTHHTLTLLNEVDQHVKHFGFELECGIGMTAFIQIGIELKIAKDINHDIEPLLAEVTPCLVFSPPSQPWRDCVGAGASWPLSPPGGRDFGKEATSESSRGEGESHAFPYYHRDHNGGADRLSTVFRQSPGNHQKLYKFLAI
jgi:hypothetical protein